MCGTWTRTSWLSARLLTVPFCRIASQTTCSHDDLPCGKITLAGCRPDAKCCIPHEQELHTTSALKMATVTVMVTQASCRRTATEGQASTEVRMIDALHSLHVEQHCTCCRAAQGRGHICSAAPTKLIHLTVQLHRELSTTQTPPRSLCVCHHAVCNHAFVGSAMQCKPSSAVSVMPSQRVMQVHCS